MIALETVNAKTENVFVMIFSETLTVQRSFANQTVSTMENVSMGNVNANLIIMGNCVILNTAFLIVLEKEFVKKMEFVSVMMDLKE